MLSDRRQLDHAARIAAAQSLAELGEAVVDAGRSLVGASGGNFFPLQVGVSHGTDAVLFHEDFSVEHLRVRTLEAMIWSARDFGELDRFFERPGSVLDLNVLLRPHGLEKTQTYNEYWRSCRIERQLFIPLGDGQHKLGFLCLTRRRAERAFGARECRVANWLGERAVVATKRLQAADLHAWDVLAALGSALPLACALFDEDGRLLWLSDRAAAQLGVALTRLGKTQFVDRSPELLRWSLAARSAVRGPPKSIDGDLLVRTVSARKQTGAILVARDDGRTALRFRLDAARRRFGLTARESEVLFEVALGRSNKSIAGGLKCSLRTVEVHVSSILRKSGRGGRAELIAALWV